MPWKNFRSAILLEKNENLLAQIAGMRGTILMGAYKLLEGEKMEIIMKAARILNLDPVEEKSWPRKLNINIDSPEGMGELTENLQYIMRVTIAKSASRELGFICLFTDGNGTYWFKVSRGFATAINESIASIEKLVDDANNKNLDEVQKEKINMIYRLLNGMYE